MRHLFCFICIRCRIQAACYGIHRYDTDRLFEAPARCGRQASATKMPLIPTTDQAHNRYAGRYTCKPFRILESRCLLWLTAVAVRGYIATHAKRALEYAIPGRGRTGLYTGDPTHKAIGKGRL